MSAHAVSAYAASSDRDPTSYFVFGITYAFIGLIALIQFIRIVRTQKTVYGCCIRNVSTEPLFIQHLLIIFICAARSVDVARLAQLLEVEKLATGMIMAAPYMMIFWLYSMNVFQWARLYHSRYDLGSIQSRTTKPIRTFIFFAVNFLLMILICFLFVVVSIKMSFYSLNVRIALCLTLAALYFLTGVSLIIYGALISRNVLNHRKRGNEAQTGNRSRSRSCTINPRKWSLASRLLMTASSMFLCFLVESILWILSLIQIAEMNWDSLYAYSPAFFAFDIAAMASIILMFTNAIALKEAEMEADTVKPSNSSRRNAIISRYSVAVGNFTRLASSSVSHVGIQLSQIMSHNTQSTSPSHASQVERERERELREHKHHHHHSSSHHTSPKLHSTTISPAATATTESSQTGRNRSPSISVTDSLIHTSFRTPMKEDSIIISINNNNHHHHHSSSNHQTPNNHPSSSPASIIELGHSRRQSLDESGLGLSRYQGTLASPAYFFPSVWRQSPTNSPWTGEEQRMPSRLSNIPELEIPSPHPVFVPKIPFSSSRAVPNLSTSQSSYAIPSPSASSSNFASSFASPYYSDSSSSSSSSSLSSSSSSIMLEVAASATSSMVSQSKSSPNSTYSKLGGRPRTPSPSTTPTHSPTSTPNHSPKHIKHINFTPLDVSNHTSSISDLDGGGSTPGYSSSAIYSSTLFPISSSSHTNNHSASSTTSTPPNAFSAASSSSLLTSSLSHSPSPFPPSPPSSPSLCASFVGTGELVHDRSMTPSLSILVTPSHPSSGNLEFEEVQQTRDHDRESF